MAADPDDRFHISLAQVVASSLAAVSAAVVCSFFGVAGTMIGTAIASLFATVGSAFYTYSLRRTRARLRQMHRAGAASPSRAEVLKTMRQQGRHLLDRFEWASVGIGTGAVFVFAIGVVAVIQDSTDLAGAPLTAHHHHHHRHGLTPPPVSTPSPPDVTPSATPSGKPSPAPHTSSSPKAVPTRTPTSSPAPTVTTTVTVTPTPMDTPLTPTPSETPGSPTPSEAST